MRSNMERSTQRQKPTSTRQQRLADDPGVSARSSTRPRRRCVLACDGTGLDNDGFVEKLVTTNDGNDGAPHVAHSRRVPRQPSVHRTASLHSDDDWRSAQHFGWLLDAVSGHTPSSYGFNQLDTSTEKSTGRLFTSTDMFKTAL